MDDHSHSDERPAVEDDLEVLFGPADEVEAAEGSVDARIWRLYTVARGYEGVSTAMTLEDAREFAVALREEGFTVLRLESACGEVLDRCDIAPSLRDAAGSR